MPGPMLGTVASARASASFCGMVRGQPILQVYNVLYLPFSLADNLAARYTQARFTHRATRRLVLNSALATCSYLRILSIAPVTGYMFGKGVYFADVSVLIHFIRPSADDSLAL